MTTYNGNPFDAKDVTVDLIEIPYLRLRPRVPDELLASPNYRDILKWVQREVELARQLQKTVVPIWIEDCELPATFADRDVIDFRPSRRIKDRKIGPMRILRHAPAKLFGREKWLDELDKAWQARDINVYTLVAWGGVGNPIRVLAGVTALPEAQFSAMAGRILPPLSLILPLWLVRSMVGWRETWQVWPALLVSGASFAVMQFYWSNFQEPGLVDIVSAIFSLVVTVAFLKVWAPAQVMPVNGDVAASAVRHSAAGVLNGWSPFIVTSVLIFVTGLPSISRYLNFDALRMPMPYLHNAVLKMPPVAPTLNQWSAVRLPREVVPTRRR